MTPTGEAVRRLLVVLTPYRDAAGRDHEARVVHLTLPEQAGTGARRRAAAKSCARWHRLLPRRAKATPQPISNRQKSEADTLPEQLFIPSQPVPAMPGARRAGTRGTWRLVFPSPRAGPPP